MADKALPHPGLVARETPDKPAYIMASSGQVVTYRELEPVDMADAGPDLERELIAFCQSQLAKYKCPRSVDFEAQLPRHPTGKLYKRLLKERYWTGHATRII